ncbi:MAG: molybdopterin cofactor-binding domain-containing protein, partial [Candidatus Hydrogenedentales bacterium]
VWTATQRPFDVRAELAEAFGISETQVRVIIVVSGGGFGGKHSGECAIEAARLAKAAGKPVNLQYTREEEFTWAYHRPAGVLDIAAAIDGEGKVTGWDYTNYNSGGSGIDCPYTFANKRTKFQACDSPLRQGSYRALASTANNFAREAFVDRLAKEVGADPLAFRQQYLEAGRLKDVLEACAEAYKWDGRENGANVGHGIACGTEKGSYVATCAQVTVDADAKTYTIDRLCVAYECGAVQNPLNLRAQVIGGVIMGLGAILREEARFKDGVMQTTNFKEYEVPRFEDVPPIDLVILNRKDVPSVGAGETPIIGVAPAVANAIFAASGTPPEKLPIRIA